MEVERYVTYPVEMTMSGLPNREELRSVSKFGISFVTIVFREGTDIYRARQLVAERLPDAAERMPSGYGTRAGPAHHGTGGGAAVRGPRRGLFADGIAHDAGMGNRPQAARGARRDRDQHAWRLLQDRLKCGPTPNGC